MYYLKVLELFPRVFTLWEVVPVVDDENTIQLWITGLLKGTNSFKQFKNDFLTYTFIRDKNLRSLLTYFNETFVGSLVKNQA